MPEYLMALGDYRFSGRTAAYDELERSTAYRWQAQDRLGERPAQQYLGIGAEEISLRGVIYPHHRGGLGQIEAMRSEAGRGEPLMLTGADGYVRGKWCIARIEESQRLFHVDGSPRQVEFRLRLVRYGADGGADLGGDTVTASAPQSIPLEMAAVGDSLSGAEESLAGVTEDLARVAAPAETAVAGAAVRTAQAAVAGAQSALGQATAQARVFPLAKTLRAAQEGAAEALSELGDARAALSGLPAQEAVGGALAGLASADTALRAARGGLGRVLTQAEAAAAASTAAPNWIPRPGGAA